MVGTLWAWWGMSSTHNQAGNNLPEPLLPSCTESQDQSEVKSKGLLRSFLSMSTASGSPGMCWSFQSLFGELTPQIHLLSFLVSLLFAPTLIYTSGSHKAKDFLQLFFVKYPWIKSSTGRPLSQVKWRQPCEQGLPKKSAGRSNNDNSLRIMFSRSSSPIPAPSGCPAMILVGCRSSRLLKSWGRGWNGAS